MIAVALMLAMSAGVALARFGDVIPMGEGFYVTDMGDNTVTSSFSKVDVESQKHPDRDDLGGSGWEVDLKIDFGAHQTNNRFTHYLENAPDSQHRVSADQSKVGPMPGRFIPGQNERLPGLIVLMSAAAVDTGACLNMAGLFDLSGITVLSDAEDRIWDTWIVGAPSFEVESPGTLFVAVANDLDGDGIFNDAPSTVPDVNGDGICTQIDLAAFGVASNIEQVLYINGAAELSDLPVVSE